MRKLTVLWALLIVAALALSACTAVQPGAAPAAGGAEAAATEAAAGEAAAADTGLLGTIQERGKLIVGTSADYPPYESINEAGEFVGFDMDLARAIAEKMGVEVEFQDMPFDSLIAALQEGKIDVVIAAMQATPERDETVDFSMEYRATKDAFLGAADSTIELTTGEDAAGYSIGAQTGTVQEKWVQDFLVGGGLTPADQAFSYERADQGGLDVQNGRIDLLLIDAEPAIALADQLGLKILLITDSTAAAGKAIALPQGETALKAELDTIIQGLMDDGTLTQIETANELPNLDQ
jgi:polar amino acid transport system substrate-binding protein